MTDPLDMQLRRYDRQVVFGGLGPAGQRRLLAAKVLIVGAGGLGSTLADLLARAGVGMLRLVDDDRVTLENLHRQVLYCEADVAEGLSKVAAARRRLLAVNSTIQVEAVAERFVAANALRLADGMDLVLDGTDNFATRLLINDVAVMTNRPWVFAGVVGAEGQIMTIIPARTVCLRCIFPEPPPVCTDPTCRSAGVLGPAVSAIAAIEASEAIKLLTGQLDRAWPGLIKIDFWDNRIRQMALSPSEHLDCRCCKRREFEYLFP